MSVPLEVLPGEASHLSPKLSVGDLIRSPYDLAPQTQHALTQQEVLEGKGSSRDDTPPGRFRRILIVRARTSGRDRREFLPKDLVRGGRVGTDESSIPHPDVLRDRGCVMTRCNLE